LAGTTRALMIRLHLTPVTGRECYTFPMIPAENARHEELSCAVAARNFRGEMRPTAPEIPQP